MISYAEWKQQRVLLETGSTPTEDDLIKQTADEIAQTVDAYVKRTGTRSTGARAALGFPADLPSPGPAPAAPAAPTSPSERRPGFLGRAGDRADAAIARAARPFSPNEPVRGLKTKQEKQAPTRMGRFINRLDRPYQQRYGKPPVADQDSPWYKRLWNRMRQRFFMNKESVNVEDLFSKSDLQEALAWHGVKRICLTEALEEFNGLYDEIVQKLKKFAAEYKKLNNQSVPDASSPAPVDSPSTRSASPTQSMPTSSPETTRMPTSSPETTRMPTSSPETTRMTDVDPKEAARQSLQSDNPLQAFLRTLKVDPADAEAAKKVLKNLAEIMGVKIPGQRTRFANDSLKDQTGKFFGAKIQKILGAQEPAAEPTPEAAPEPAQAAQDTPAPAQEEPAPRPARPRQAKQAPAPKPKKQKITFAPMNRKVRKQIESLPPNYEKKVVFLHDLLLKKYSPADVLNINPGLYRAIANAISQIGDEGLRALLAGDIAKWKSQN